jgi:hypothetical protein
MSDRPAGPACLREYALRMSIEQSFRDAQSGGFDLEHTQLRQAERLERLLLAVALATLRCHELGEQVPHMDEAAWREINPCIANLFSWHGSRPSNSHQSSIPLLNEICEGIRVYVVVAGGRIVG